MVSSELQVARHAARVGGDVVARLFADGCENTAKEESRPYNLVSEADVASEKVILAAIREAFPDHGILAEESAAETENMDQVWIVDPIDGTSNFVHGIPHFAVSIGYYEGGVAQCGVVYNPITGDHYEAVRGEGAFYNGRPIRVNCEETLDRILVAVGFYYDRGKMMESTLSAISDLFRRQIRGLRRFGTASLDLCNVACGRFGAFFEFELSPWDFAAGSLIVSEAGGRMSNCGGAPLPLSKTSVLATNGLLHETLQEIVGPRQQAGASHD